MDPIHSPMPEATAMPSGTLRTLHRDCMGRDPVVMSVRMDPMTGRGGCGLELACDRTWCVGRHHLDGSPRTLAGWSPSDAIQVGLGALNRPGMLAYGERLVLFVNKRLVGTIADRDDAFSFGFPSPMSCRLPSMTSSSGACARHSGINGQVPVDCTPHSDQLHPDGQPRAIPPIQVECVTT